MILYLAGIATLLQLVLAFNMHATRVCTHSQKFPFTGYKVENQISIGTRINNYHLLYCNDNKLIFDLVLNDTVPWAMPLQFGRKDNILVLSRRKTFARRAIPIYLPTTLVGALFTMTPSASNGESKVPQHSIPLVAENIAHNWLELNYKGEMVFHIPILTTPRIDSRKSRYKEDETWDQYISASENYEYAYDSRAWFRQDADSILKSIDEVLELDSVNISAMGFNSESGSLFWKLILISKVISQESFTKFIVRIEKMLGSEESIKEKT